MADQQAPHRAPRPSRRPRLLLLGHSHIVRLKQYIRRTPDRRLDFGSPVWVDHEGTPGLTVSRAKDNFINLYGEPDALQQMPRRSRLRQMPRRSRPDMVMLFIGDNDVLPRYGPPRYAPSFIIRKIVKLVRFILRYRGIKTVCVLGLLPRVTNTEDPEDRHIEYNRRAAEINHHLHAAAKNNPRFMFFQHSFYKSTNRTLDLRRVKECRVQQCGSQNSGPCLVHKYHLGPNPLFDKDRVHLTSQGYYRLYKSVKQAVAQQLTLNV